MLIVSFCHAPGGALVRASCPVIKAHSTRWPVKARLATGGPPSDEPGCSSRGGRPAGNGGAQRSENSMAGVTKWVSERRRRGSFAILRDHNPYSLCYGVRGVSGRKERSRAGSRSPSSDGRRRTAGESDARARVSAALPHDFHPAKRVHGRRAAVPVLALLRLALMRTFPRARRPEFRADAP